MSSYLPIKSPKSSQLLHNPTALNSQYILLSIMYKPSLSGRMDSRKMVPALLLLLLLITATGRSLFTHDIVFLFYSFSFDILFLVLDISSLFSLNKIEMGPVKKAEARFCDSQSHKYKGACIRSSNCENVCHNEGFPTGVCKTERLERKCFCRKAC
jgi:Gamma-thionin family